MYPLKDILTLQKVETVALIRPWLLSKTLWSKCRTLLWSHFDISSCRWEYSHLKCSSISFSSQLIQNFISSSASLSNKCGKAQLSWGKRSNKCHHTMQGTLASPTLKTVTDNLLHYLSFLLAAVKESNP